MWWQGSIPARAGEPPCTSSALAVRWVYPRACGGTRLTHTGTLTLHGLSPRVRGNRVVVFPVLTGNGSIPARAGEPAAQIRRRSRRTVYPRACGGTRLTHTGTLTLHGLSPRVRGNRVVVFPVLTGNGSIPARAGEPAAQIRRRSRRTVYPRACGGTIDGRRLSTGAGGLSPRVRGNLRQCIPRPRWRWSIPARAGEPGRRLPGADWKRVYPRACGGTGGSDPAPKPKNGLSPRVRGNHARCHPFSPSRRSIPARAGEPTVRSCERASVRVYPRACGGTMALLFLRLVDCGLSPRVRGNRGVVNAQTKADRSIPARAGEPMTWRLPCRFGEVYPRACGGTSSSLSGRNSSWGLSPRVRGNQPRRYPDTPPTVYPRACGGTQHGSRLLL